MRSDRPRTVRVSGGSLPIVQPSNDKLHSQAFLPESKELDLLMRIDRLVGPTMLALILCIAIPSMSFAGDGLFRRIAQQRNSKRSAQPVSHPTPRAATNISKSRLPSGRNYYQGRYYGNLNNRFYGPQYGYF